MTTRPKSKDRCGVPGRAPPRTIGINPAGLASAKGELRPYISPVRRRRAAREPNNNPEHISELALSGFQPFTSRLRAAP